MAKAMNIASVSGSVGFAHNTPTADYTITLPNKNDTMAGLGDVIGVNQTWQEAEYTNTGAVFSDGTAKYRATGITYTNSSGKPIMISIQHTQFASSVAIMTINGLKLSSGSGGTGADIEVNSFVIPNGSTYSITGVSNSLKWLELR